MTDTQSAQTSEATRTIEFETRPTPSTEQVVTGAAVLAGIVPLTVYEGLAIRKLWNWFVPNTFPGAPELTMAQAVGLSSLSSVLVPQSLPPFKPKKKNELPSPQEMRHPIILRSSVITAALLVGAIAKRYVRN
jgi:hypothetical protein